MQFVGRIVTSVSGFYKDINPSTLSGAIDILVIEDVTTGQLISSPFHVRFGKLQLLRPHEKIVEISINGRKVEPEETGIAMKVGEAGESFFVIPSEGPVPPDYQTSPIAKPMKGYSAVMDDLSLSPVKSSRPENESSSTLASAATNPSKRQPVSDSELDDREVLGLRRTNTLPSSPVSDSELDYGKTSSDQRHLRGIERTAQLAKSDGEDDELESFPPSTHAATAPASPLPSQVALSSPSTRPQSKEEPTPSSPKWTWMWGGLPTKTDKTPTLAETEEAMKPSIEITAEATKNEATEPAEGGSPQLVPDEIDLFDYLNEKDTVIRYHERLASQVVTPEQSSSLHFILHSLSLSKDENANEDEEGSMSSLAARRPVFAEDAELEAFIGQRMEVVGMQEVLNADLSGGENESGKRLVLSITLKDNTDPSRICYFSGAIVMNMVLSLTIYHQVPPLHNLLSWSETNRRLRQRILPPIPSVLTPVSMPPFANGSGSEEGGTHKHGGWRHWWRRSNKHENGKGNKNGDTSSAVSQPTSRPDSPSDTETVLSLDLAKGNAAADLPLRNLARALSSPDLQVKSSSSSSPPPSPPSSLHYAKSLRLPSEQLRKLDLSYGSNTVTFSVATRIQGRATCSARIFLWRSSEHIIISDIDGTITKSDALGHLFTMVGKDWTHLGVANLYHNIHKNGYRFLFLTSRAIGQANATRGYLKGIEQNKFQLPEGPVIMSPDRLLAALRREVIVGNPEEFKIACLLDIRRLFQPDAAEQSEDAGVNPFYAGFGNRNTDTRAYLTVGIPPSRIFTINSSGDVCLEVLGGAGSTSYAKLVDLVDHIFPPLNNEDPSTLVPSVIVHPAAGVEEGYLMGDAIVPTYYLKDLKSLRSRFDGEPFNEFWYWKRSYSVGSGSGGAVIEPQALDIAAVSSLPAVGADRNAAPATADFYAEDVQPDTAHIALPKTLPQGGGAEGKGAASPPKPVVDKSPSKSQLKAVEDVTGKLDIDEDDDGEDEGADSFYYENAEEGLIPAFPYV